LPSHDPFAAVFWHVCPGATLTQIIS
jgi:hypothetical protein